MKKLLLKITLFCSFLITLNAFAGVEPDQEESIDNSIIIDRIGNSDIDITLPSIIFTFQEVTIKLKFHNPNQTKLLINKNKLDFIINGESIVLTFVDGEASYTHKFDTSNRLSIFVDDFSYNNTVTAYPIWAILVPVGLILLWIMMRIMKRKKA